MNANPAGQQMKPTEMRSQHTHRKQREDTHLYAHGVCMCGVLREEVLGTTTVIRC